ncbi:hypothetical protein B0H21DRAFT_455656 [Amylocystis lapponica]|nr:hypothetical protein B0H21DRAFT_455656 [Amylocystis lapponica]
MVQSVSDSAFSPIPFSPFSSYSVASGITSDDAPDLGAFTTVFRALGTLQPRTGNGHLTDVESATPNSSLAFSQSDYDSEPAAGSTVWLRDPVASYLSYSSPGDSVSRGRSPAASESDTTASDVERTDLPDLDNIDTVDQPSLGLLDEALGFIAAERAKFVAAQRETGMRGNSSTTTTTSDSVWKHVIQPRRKRRRKKNRSVQEVSRVRASEQTEEAQTETTANANDDVDTTAADDDDAYESSSSVEISSSPPHLKSTPGTPPHSKKGKRRASVEPRPLIHHSKSTPALRLPVTIPFDARALQLRTLAHKLRLLFPADAAALSSILSLNNPESSTFIDPRGPSPQSQDTLIHVFIDHSNILIGFITYLRRHPHHITRKAGRHMSYAALALILERGRPITRRVLVASSPLYQPLDAAEQIGYEVRVYARVPDTGGGADRQRTHSSPGDAGALAHTSPPAKGRGRKAVPGPSRGHAHKMSAGGGGTSTESETGAGVSNGARIRYREQGVDELLQLKLHQAIADVDVVPAGATIMLATGDGNVGQFNEEGFLGCVRTALKKGWRVELYAWEGGLSKAWMREFGESPYSSRFQIHILDLFAMDLLEI